MSSGKRMVMISGYLPEALHADGTVKEEHRCPLCPGPGEAVTIDIGDLGDLGDLLVAETADPADLGDFGRLGDLAQLLAVPTPPARGRSRGKRRRRR